jgi:hypothetical protein
MWRVTLASVAACCLLAVIQMSGMLEQPSDDVTVLSYHPPWEQAPPHYNRYRFKSTTQQLTQVKSIKHQQHTVKSKTVKIETGRAIFARLKAAAGPAHGKRKGRGKVSAKLSQMKTIKHQKHTVKSKPAKKVESGKAIFARLTKASVSLEGKTKGKGKVSAPKLAEDEEDTPEAKEGAQEPPKEGAEETKDEEDEEPKEEETEDPKDEAEEPKDEAEEPKEEAEEPKEDADEDADEPKAEESAEAPVEEEAAEEDPKTIYVYDGRETKPFSTDLVTFILAAGFAMPDIRYIKSSSDADIR